MKDSTNNGMSSFRSRSEGILTGTTLSRYSRSWRNLRSAASAVKSRCVVASRPTPTGIGAVARIGQDQRCGIGRSDVGTLVEQLTKRFRGPNNLLKHRFPINLLA